MFFCAESLVGEAGLVNWNYSLCWCDRRRYDGMLRQQQWQQEMGCHGEHAGTNIALCIIASSDRRPSSTTGNQGLLLQWRQSSTFITMATAFGFFG